MPGDDFDPRPRVWYKGAIRTDGVYWSQPYVFFTTRAPGITASIRLTQSGKPDRVFGVDITLEALSDFLASLHIGRTGRAAILDSEGHVIAAPDLVHSAGTAPATTADRAASTALTDKALLAAYDRYRIEGFGNHTILVGKQPTVTIASRLPAAGQNWVLLIAAPETDFTSFAETCCSR